MAPSSLFPRRVVLLLLVALLLPGTVALYAQDRYKKQRLKVSDNRRFLVYEDGTPFFWLADTGWELFHRLTLKEARQYLHNRRKKGFTVIQAVVLAEEGGLHVPNAEGHLPLHGDDPMQPDEAYFRDMDAVIKAAAREGIFIALLPTWGSNVRNTRDKGDGIFTVDNARGYGRFLAGRYKDQWNIIWILGGDRLPRDAKSLAIWRAMAQGIEAGAGGAGRALITYHPQPHEPGGSSDWFHRDAWLDFNMHQTGHCKDDAVYLKITHDYNLQPVKPVLDGESLYEDHPICFDAKKYGYSKAADVRKKFYWDLFAGAFGITYGCHDIWQFNAPQRQPVNGPPRYWYDALDLPGAFQAGIVKRLMCSRPFLQRIPDNSILTGDRHSGADYITATRASDGSYAMVYSATGQPFTVQLGKLQGDELKAWWFSPRDGKAAAAGTFPARGEKRFTPPSSGYDNDWVLVLDDAGRHFPAPGR
ncbi:glycoside hydrolase family 140 protein [Compostibacter hankyongensis]|uniref:Glycoside hydrolase family 140 protein n=1 Tax=Compostibacter hankyongensis TaxID=1007089 RepID=A0ABP8G0Y8_9BACT